MTRRPCDIYGKKNYRKFILTSGAKHFVLISRTVLKLQQCKYAGGGYLPPPLSVYDVQIPLPTLGLIVFLINLRNFYPLTDRPTVFFKY